MPDKRLIGAGIIFFLCCVLLIYFNRNSKTSSSTFALDEASSSSSIFSISTAPTSSSSIFRPTSSSIFRPTSSSTFALVPTSSSLSQLQQQTSSLALLQSKLDKVWDTGVPYGIDIIKYKSKISQIAQAVLDNCGTASFDACVGYVQYMLDMNGAINSVYQKDNTKFSQLPVPWTVYNFDCTSVQKDLTRQDLVPLFNSTSERIERNIAGIPNTSTIDIEKIKRYIPELTIRSMFYSTCKGTNASDYTGCADWIVYVLDKPAYVYQFNREPPLGDWSYGFDGALVQKTLSAPTSSTFSLNPDINTQIQRQAELDAQAQMNMQKDRLAEVLRAQTSSVPAPSSTSSSIFSISPAPTSSSTFRPTSSTFRPTSSSLYTPITVITDNMKLYYGNKLESGVKIADKTPFLGFNTNGQFIYNDGTTSTVIVGNAITPATLQTPIDPSKTYIELVNSPPVGTTGSGKVGIAIYRNGLMYYEKYKLIPRVAYSATSEFILITRITANDNWVIKKDNVDFLTANDQLVASYVIENRIAI